MSTTDLAQYDPKVLDVLQSSLYPGAARESVAMVVAYCQEADLDVMQKPVHIVPMYVKDAATGNGQMRDVVMPGIGLYRIQAARTGKYAGMSEPEFGPDVTETLNGVQITYPVWCRIKVMRTDDRGNVATFTAMEFWKENYATAGRNTSSPNAMWLKRPYGQLSKCTEAQALRKAFPEACSAPTAEEMEGKSFDFEQPQAAAKTPPAAERAPESKPPYSAADFERNAPIWQQAFDKGKSPDQLIATISAKYQLSAQQIEAIHALAPIEHNSEHAA